MDEQESSISSSWMPLAALSGQADHSPVPLDIAPSATGTTEDTTATRFKFDQRQVGGLADSGYMLVAEVAESMHGKDQRSGVVPEPRPRDESHASVDEREKGVTEGSPQSGVQAEKSQRRTGTGEDADNEGPIVTPHSPLTQSTQPSNSTSITYPLYAPSPNLSAETDRHLPTPVDPSPHIIHVPMPPALDQEDPVMISSPQATFESGEAMDIDEEVQSEEGGSEGRDCNVAEQKYQQEGKVGKAIGATKGNEASASGGLATELDSGWILPQPVDRPLASSSLGSSLNPSRQPPTLGRAMGPPAPATRPMSTVGGEEALSAMSAEGSFRRPGVKASTGPGEEADEGLNMLDVGHGCVGGSAVADVDQGQAAGHSGSVGVGLPSRGSSGDGLEGSYLTIVAAPADVSTSGAGANLEYRGGEMEILTAPPPRSSSIPGNLSQEALSIPTSGPRSPSSPPSSTWPKMHRPQSPSSSPLPHSNTFDLPPVMISQQRPTSSASASSSTTSFPSYKGKGREEDRGLPEGPIEKKEGRGTRLRKKTSKLFRIPSKDKDRSAEQVHSSPPLARSGQQAPGLFTRTSTATSASSLVSRSSVGTPTRQRFSTAPPGLNINGTPSPPPQITMTRPSTHDLISLQRRTSRSSSSSSMDMPLPGRRMSDLVQSATSEKKGRLSLPTMKRTSEPARRRQSSDVASIVSSSIGSLRGHGKAKRAGSSSNGLALPTQVRGDHASDAGDSIESLREEDIPGDNDDVFVSASGPRPIAARAESGKAPSIAPSASASSSFPSRMSSWFTNVMPNAQASTSAALSNSQGLSQRSTSPGPKVGGAQGPAQLSTSTSTSSSPGRRGTTAAASLFNAARQKAVGGMRYLMDVDAQPDGCSTTIWLMGVTHDFPESPPSGDSMKTFDRVPEVGNAQTGSSGSTTRKGVHRRQSSASNILLDKAHGIAAAAFQPSSPSRRGPGTDRADSPGRSLRQTQGKEKEAVVWPSSFLIDYQSAIWCSYRSQYAPISALPSDLLLPNPTSYLTRRLPSLPEQAAPSSQRSGWTWLPSVAPPTGLTSDSGWGCMLRTGQSMLANALVRLHLGREFRKPSAPPTLQSDSGQIARYAAYVQILSWFLDDPAGICPFSVHRMALIGKQLGKEIGEWFGPSTAAGAIKTLTNAFPPCGISVVMATDGVLYRSEVLEASHTSKAGWEAVESQLCLARIAPRTAEGTAWGGQAVLVLAGVRLGLDGVNAVYHDSVKALFTFPQSVGIAGGRPSSSYYFIGTQADSLFYLDPHFTRPAVPLKTPEERCKVFPTSESFATVTMESCERGGHISDGDGAQGDAASTSTGRETTSSHDDGLDDAARVEWLAQAYTDQQLSTFHCDKVKKMPMSGLDPSMLLGFLCRNEAEWDDLVQRLDSLKHTVLSIQQCPPSWAEDDFSDGPSIESFSETTMEDDGMGSLSGSSNRGHGGSGVDVGGHGTVH